MIHRKPAKRDLTKPRAGAAAVEMALLLPALIVVLVITVDWARLFYFNVTVTNCARNAALWQADTVLQAQSRYTTLQAAALADWPSSLSTQPTVDSPVNGTDSAGNAYVEVTVHYAFQTLTTYLGSASNVNLTRTVRARVPPVTAPN